MCPRVSCMSLYLRTGSSAWGALSWRPMVPGDGAGPEPAPGAAPWPHRPSSQQEEAKRPRGKVSPHSHTSAPPGCHRAGPKASGCLPPAPTHGSHPHCAFCPRHTTPSLSPNLCSQGPFQEDLGHHLEATGGGRQRDAPQPRRGREGEVSKPHGSAPRTRQLCAQASAWGQRAEGKRCACSDALRQG